MQTVSYSMCPMEEANWELQNKAEQIHILDLWQAETESVERWGKRDKLEVGAREWKRCSLSGKVERRKHLRK